MFFYIVQQYAACIRIKYKGVYEIVFYEDQLLFISPNIKIKRFIEHTQSDDTIKKLNTHKREIKPILSVKRPLRQSVSFSYNVAY